MIYLGLDPGKSGAIAVLRGDGEPQAIIRLKATEHDIATYLQEWRDVHTCFAVLEQVSAMPRQGVSSTFKFGQSYGLCRGLLVAIGIPFETVTPAKWQRAMGCLSKGDKNVTKAKAQELFPAVKVTHATADALLLAEYCRRLKTGQLT